MTDENDDNTFSDEHLKKFKTMVENLENSDISMNNMESVFENLESGTQDIDTLLENIQKMSESFEGMKDLMENLHNNSDVSGSMNNDKSDVADSTESDNTNENLKKILYDFTNDLLKSFPELKNTLDENLVAIINNEDTEKEVIAIRTIV